MIKIRISADNISVYTCRPKNNEELREIILDRTKKEGPNCDLNDIDVSEITNMYWLFAKSNFNGDISRWNMSNVKYMNYMFYKSSFNGDISDWNVSNSKTMYGMFYKAKFNQDISNWKISKGCNIVKLFEDCPIREEFKPKYQH